VTENEFDAEEKRSWGRHPRWPTWTTIRRHAVAIFAAGVLLLGALSPVLILALSALVPPLGVDVAPPLPYQARTSPNLVVHTRLSPKAQSGVRGRRRTSPPGARNGISSPLIAESSPPSERVGRPEPRPASPAPQPRPSPPASPAASPAAPPEPATPAQRSIERLQFEAGANSHAFAIYAAEMAAFLHLLPPDAAGDLPRAQAGPPSLGTCPVGCVSTISLQTGQIRTADEFTYPTRSLCRTRSSPAQAGCASHGKGGDTVDS